MIVRCKLSAKIFKVAGFCWFAVSAFITFSQGPLLACGPYFPNYLLVGGDEAVLGGAELSFTRELQRMNLVPTRHKALPTRGTFAEEAERAEVADLKAALKKEGLCEEEAAGVLSAHAEARKQLTVFAAQVKEVEDSRPHLEQEGKDTRGAPALPWPNMPAIQITPGLPGEFADYFEGALAWHNPINRTKDAARLCWERLLERPEAERKRKSVWAAFMLARSWLEEDPPRAIDYLHQVRALASRGFADTIGLSAASLGVEARVELLHTNYVPAIALYLEQLAAGDEGAAISLRFVAAEALRARAATLEKLARDSRSQRIITAYVLSQPIRRRDYAGDAIDPELGSQSDWVRRWLSAMEASGVKDAESAEKFALAAYNINDMQLAQRWIKLAPNAPVAQWLQAKLLLRSGKVAEAAALLAKVSRLFPVQPHGTNEVEAVQLADTLMAGTCEGNLVPVERQLLGELGVLRLSRKEFTQSLDALLNSGFWMDAAYVAERVLTVDELKGYVDSYWPPVSASQEAEEKENFGEDKISPSLLRGQIRYLLARRLTRAERSAEAREYYPAEWLPPFDALMANLGAAWNESLPAEHRAGAFFQAAYVARTNGMELLGTEVEPDWHIHGGNFSTGVSIADRKTNAAEHLPATQEELARASRHAPEPEKAFHYRYQAASLAWQAAELLPNNSDFTAFILWKGGSWLKYQDPPFADIFYKALVRRNRATALGAEADRRRWFPELDEKGNILPRRSKASVSEPSEEPENSSATAPETERVSNVPAEETGTPDPNPRQAENFYRYTVGKGDSFSRIVSLSGEAGNVITLRELYAANPGVERQKLRVGQVIQIPVFDANARVEIEQPSDIAPDR